jgi:hypothetical protein
MLAEKMKVEQRLPYLQCLHDHQPLLDRFISYKSWQGPWRGWHPHGHYQVSSRRRWQEQAQA